jgi:O-antigen ligase
VPVRGARVAALTLLALAVGVTLFAATRAERHGGTAATGASAARLVSAQSNRYEYWRVAVRAFRREPLRGDGSGAFRTDWLRERPFAESVRDAHSLYLETAAELGLVGLAALGAFLGGVAASARAALRRERTAVAGAVAALVAWAVHAGLDWDWEMPALTLVALVLAARLAPGDAAPAPSAAARPAAS